ncbi:sulfotransferase family protein [Sphingomonas jaspsi]|uniref:sulfotransferase family protein n=1 Tax=Sphingomonas jaspsi TaxID=392409 RepID=UPI000A04A823|nr:sulfotransferase [Sphingomonas jaspsi]
MSRGVRRTDLNRRFGAMLERAWDRGAATRPSLDPADIIAIASRKEGGPPADGPWRTRLDILCAALRDEADLNPIGLTSAHVQLVKLVRARIRAAAYVARHPGALDIPIERPLVIVGQMRSGTTRIHRLLACDRDFEVNRLFEQLDPVPHRGIDRRPVNAWITGKLFALMAPELSAIHPTSPLAAEEDFGLHAFSIWGALFEGQWRVPSFAAHVEQADPADVYRDFATLLRINAHRRRRPGPWLLKAPQFAQELDAVLAAFPDARLVVLRRPPAELVASGASLVWHHSRVQSDAVTRAEIGREWLRKTRLRGERMDEALARHQRQPQVELDYADVSRDWAGAVDRIYRLCDGPPDPATWARMDRLIASSTAHHGHRYSLEDFGLDAAAVDAAFA